MRCRRKEREGAREKGSHISREHTYIIVWFPCTTCIVRLPFPALWFRRKCCFRHSYASPDRFGVRTVLRRRSCVAFRVPRELARDPVIYEQIHFSLNPSQPRADPLPMPYSINWPLKSRAIFHPVRLLSLESVHPWDQKLWTGNVNDSISSDGRSIFLFLHKYQSTRLKLHYDILYLL